MKKNDRIELSITDMGIDGEGIGRFDACTFFVKDALPGDYVSAVITKLKKGYGYAKMLRILEPSSHRVEPACLMASRCGGCQIMQLEYKEQLRLKKEKVRNNLLRIGGLKEVRLQDVIGMPENDSFDTADSKHAEMPLHFRNKMQFPVGSSKDGRAITGFYAGRTHYIIETTDCPVAAPETAILLEKIRQFIDENHISIYDETTGEGLVRHVLIRSARASGQTMVCLVINADSLAADLCGRFVQALLETDISEYHSRLTGVCLNVNRENTNVILGNRIIPLYGTPYIEERIRDLIFRVSPLAFFQVNHIQTEQLYNKALEYAGLTGKETVWDLYCGTGTISLFLAQNARQVYGVEIIPQAIENAQENAAINRISNVQFFCGKSEEIFPRMCTDTKVDSAAGGSSPCAAPEIPEVVVLDPPRKGCDPALLYAILQVKPDRIIYVSCDSATLARDIKILSGTYTLQEATPVDMFPHTMHIETVALLSKKESGCQHTIVL